MKHRSGVSRPWLASFAAVAALALGGCAGNQAPDRFHTLLPAERAPAAAATAAPGAAALYVDVLPVRVPAQVDHAQWVLRQPDDSLLLLEHERWAAPLPDELRSALVEALGARWGATDVRSVAAPAPAVWRLRVDVQRFESLPGREARLEAAWSLSSTQRGGAALVCRGAFREAANGPGVPALAAAHRRAVVQLADAIGRDLRALQAGEVAGCG
jgi:uncharacterized lipoprotein YmbA